MLDAPILIAAELSHLLAGRAGGRWVSGLRVEDRGAVVDAGLPAGGGSRALEAELEAARSSSKQVGVPLASSAHLTLLLRATVLIFVMFFRVLVVVVFVLPVVFPSSSFSTFSPTSPSRSIPTSLNPTPAVQLEAVCKLHETANAQLKAKLSSWEADHTAALR